MQERVGGQASTHTHSTPLFYHDERLSLNILFCFSSIYGGYLLNLLQILGSRAEFHNHIFYNLLRSFS